MKLRDKKLGYLNRMSKLINKDGSFFLLAMDHQFSTTRLPSLDNLEDVLTSIPSCISGSVLNFGSNISKSPYGTNLIIQVTGGSGITNNISKINIHDLEAVISLDPTAISTQINFENDDNLNQTRDVAKVVSEFYKYQIPVLIMVNYSIELTTKDYYKFTKICNELGADLIKIGLPIDVNKFKKDIKKYNQNMPPILLAGGARDKNLKASIKLAKKIGFSGLCIGRNVFQSKNLSRTAKRINKWFNE